MTSWMPWKIAKKDFKVIKRKKSIIFYVVGLPLLLAAAFSLLVNNDVTTSNVSNATLGLAALTYIFVILAAVLPTSIAAYSIVGEKVERSLEPLLATPTTDSQILLGKSIAAFVPSILATWLGASIFMAVTDYLTHDLLGYYYFPSWIPGILLLLLAPLAALLGIEVAVILSARVSDVRGANQLGGLMWIPFMAVFIAGVDGVITFDLFTLLFITAIVLILDVALFFVSKSTFNREEILTNWK
jgi:ABC-2 type transport system permease protein